MKQEDKELLLKDLCARIPYGVKGCCEDETFRTTPLHWYAENTLEYSVNYMVVKNGWRPYLFPLSSMTNEHHLEIEILTNGQIAIDKYSLWDLSGCSELSLSQTLEVFDWLNRNHFDYRGLIEKGLAIDATGLNVY